MTRTSRSALMLLASLFVVALVAAPSVSAALTITQVEVVIGTVTYCDTSISGCDVTVWNLGGGGVTLNPGETFILAQTGAIGGSTAGNFDTSERYPVGPLCDSGSPCRVQVLINSGAGLTSVYDNSGGNPLNAGNADPGGSFFNEAAAWQTVFAGPAYSLDIGYADNTHTDACAAAGIGGCFPQANFPTGATFFNAAPLTIAPFYGCGVEHPLSDDGGCYEGGALRITANAQLEGTCPLTQGFWKNHPGAWPVGTLNIGGFLYSEAQLLTILKKAPKGDASLILAHQLIAALLSIDNGAVEPANVATAISQAQALLTGCDLTSGPGCGVPAASPTGQQMVAVAAVLDSFNNGAFTPVCTRGKRS